MHFSTIFAFVLHIRLGAQFYLILEPILEPFRSRAAMVFASKICVKKARKTSAQKAVARQGFHTFPTGGVGEGGGGRKLTFEAPWGRIQEGDRETYHTPGDPDKRGRRIMFG